ncbi:hypothetical protein ACFYPA_06505 [Streptomyces sp. NPDC005775]|uniref:hypothetical protein n=1 Tax=Streptomyces sp. NPDC005775 TaxID=3364729 RepID=UPI0036CEE1EC
MSLPTLHLIRRTEPKPVRKHRAADKAELKRQLKDQQAQTARAFGQLIGAADTIAFLEHQLAEERAGRSAAEQVANCLFVDLEERTGQRDQARTEADRLRTRLAPYLAADANRDAITVPPAERDTTAVEDQATAPIDVKPLWQAHGIGPVVRIADTPDTTDPRTPTWVPGPAEPDSETTHTFRVVAA